MNYLRLSLDVLLNNEIKKCTSARLDEKTCDKRVNVYSLQGKQ